jgi:hypothetical protein
VRYELGFYIPEDGILHARRRENLKSYTGTFGFLGIVYGGSGYISMANIITIGDLTVRHPIIRRTKGVKDIN